MPIKIQLPISIAIVLSVLWLIHLSRARSDRKVVIQRYEKARKSDKRALLQIYKEDSIDQEIANNLGLRDGILALLQPLIDEVHKHPQGVDGWVVDNLKSPTFDDFYHLTPFLELGRDALRSRLNTALSRQNHLEVIICLAYCDKWEDARRAVGETLFGDAVKMHEEYKAARQRTAR